MVSRGLCAAVTVAVTVLGGMANAEEKVLNVYNWSDYIAEDTIEKFEAETGIKVNYDVFDSNEIVEAKLLTGSTGYDVVVPTANFLERQIKAGVFRKLDPAKLPNLKNMDPVISQRVALHDPGNEHSVTYMWGTTGFGYNVKAITERLGEMPTNTWALFFDPAVVSKLADCGVSLLDAPNDVMATALKYLGLDPNSESPDDLAKAEELQREAEAKEVKDAGRADLKAQAQARASARAEQIAQAKAVAKAEAEAKAASRAADRAQAAVDKAQARAEREAGKGIGNGRDKHLQERLFSVFLFLL